MSNPSLTPKAARLSESIMALENRLLELQNKYDARHAELKLAEAVTMKNVEEAANKASTQAMDRVIKVVDLARNVLLALVVIAVAAGVGGYFQIQSQVKDIVLPLVKSWLNVSEKSSPLHDPLSRLTTRAAVNALVMERARYGARSPFMGNLKITAVWVDKMLVDLMDPSTSESDFADLALALASEAPMTGASEHRSRILDTIRKALLEPGVSIYRKTVLLRTFGMDPTLADTAQQLFLNTRNADVKSAAFKFLRRSLAPAALVELAKPLLAEEVPAGQLARVTLQLDAAQVLAEVNPGNPELSAFMARRVPLAQHLDNALIGLAALEPIATQSDLNYHAISTEEQKKRLDFAVPLIAAAIDSGAAISWTASPAGHPVIALRVQNKHIVSLYSLPEPKTLLTAALGDRLLSHMGRDTKGIAALVQAISGGDADSENYGRPFRVKINLNDNDSITTTTGEVLTKARLGNPLYLERDLENAALIAIRWRDTDGIFKLGYLAQASLAHANASIVAASAGSGNYIGNYSYNLVAP